MSPNATSKKAASKPERRVAIVGLYHGPLRRDIEDWEVWTMNDGWRDLAGYTRLYELHAAEHRPWRPDTHWEHLAENAEKVWRFPPASEFNAYPLIEILDAYPVYHTCSISWMIAQALHEGVTHIGLERLNFATFHERMLERPCVEWWLGYAKGLGVQVEVSRASALLSGPFLYGVQDTSPEHSALYNHWRIAFPAAYEAWFTRFGTMPD